MRLYRQLGLTVTAVTVGFWIAWTLVGCTKKDDQAASGPSSEKSLEANKPVAKPAGDDLVEVTVIADTVSPQVGQPFRIGVLLDIEPEWHIYWKYPGDAGLPTEVEFEAWPGVEIGPLEFPLPVRFEQPGGIVGYGYKGKVMLIAEAVLKTGRPPSLKPPFLRAEVSWLACKEVCLPGRGKAELTLKPGAATTNTTSDAIDVWAARLPADFSAIPDGQVQSQSKTDNRGRLELVANVTAPGRILTELEEVMPIPPDGYDLLGIEHEVKDGILMVMVRLQPLPQEPQNGQAVEFLMVYRDAQGNRRGYVVSAPF